MNHVLRYHYHRSDGFTLIEILVAVLVLTIGLLGLAGLQVSGLRFNQSAYLRTQATLLAYEMADRMRANPVGFINGDYNNPAPANIAGCSDGSGCAPAEMAQNDMQEWRAKIARLLPGNATGVVCQDSGVFDDGTPPPGGNPACAGGTTYAIKVWWDDQRTGDPNQYQRFVVTQR
ncbi:MAG: type IV pilus modification protein PilV [Candidatus Contendobacter odensis]|uniref:Type IV pilus modification protein PilV n=1 Tax=Candidatus Contendibacter odensensis TaxID=1400860 RepID=A0A2G6PFR4_9GAMM|nr:MAG: type IV pilus modification protein PilV [Candidatus Contendobacter odensis]